MEGIPSPCFAANEKRAKELAEVAVQAEREARLKAESDLNAERAMSESERKLRITAEADRRASTARRSRRRSGRSPFLNGCLEG